MKKIISLMLMSLMIILMARIGYGAVTCAFDQAATTAGTSSSYIRSTAVNLSATLTVGDEGINATSATISAGATGCTISGTLNFNSTGLVNTTYFNTTVNTLAMSDDTSCTFTMTVKNVTAQNTLATCTRIFISDNTKPVLSGLSPSDGSEDSDGTVDFSATCTNSSSATLYAEGNSYTMTESSDVCTLTVSGLRNSLQSWYVTGSDGLNSSTSSTTKVEIRKSGGVIIRDGQQVIGAAQITTAQKSTGILEILSDLFKFPLKLINGVIGAIFGIFQ